MNRRIAILLVFFVIFILSAGCSSTTSDNIKTSGIYALFNVENKYGENTVTAKATLQVGGITGSYIKLVGDDELLCDGQKLSSRETALGSIEYVANLPKKNAGEKYVFKFKRKDEEHTIEVTQLQDVHITAPKQSQSFKISDDIKVTWEPKSTEDMDLTIDGDCIDPHTKIFQSDNGEYLITGGTLKFDENADSKKCTAKIIVRRYTSTGVPKEFDGGNAFSYSISEVDIQITE